MSLYYFCYLYSKIKDIKTGLIMSCHNEECKTHQGEVWNGRAAMLGVVAALGAYALTGQVIPGIW
jgi:hypothetical protein